MEVTAARKTAAGFLLLQFARETRQGQIDKVGEEIAKAMGSAARVSNINKRKTIQIKDVDELTTREDMEEALKQALPGSEHRLMSMRPGFGGTQRVMVNCVYGPALGKIITDKKVRVGFLACRVRVLPNVMRCFRCHELGHIAAKCNIDPAIKEVCRKCGSHEHSMALCQNKPRCQLCIRRGMPENRAGHVTAAAACPVIKAL